MAAPQMSVPRLMKMLRARLPSKEMHTRAVQLAGRFLCNLSRVQAPFPESNMPVFLFM